jgi:5-enolpyruvylshikimate-3-phosphate synthase
MAFAIAGQMADDEVRISDVANVATSVPRLRRTWRARPDSACAPG